MPTFIALLRGVNVGRARRVPMADLRNLMSGLGYEDVATVLNSGNAVFTSPKPAAAVHAAGIAAALRTGLGVDVPVIVRSAGDFSAIVSENPFAASAGDPSRLFVVFVQDAAALEGLATIGPLVAPPERFLVGRRAAYLHCATGILESKAGEALLGRAGMAATTRNWATVLRLEALVAARGR